MTESESIKETELTEAYQRGYGDALARSAETIARLKDENDELRAGRTRWPSETAYGGTYHRDAEITQWHERNRNDDY